MPFSPCLLDTNCWLYITPASSAPAQILHHIACLDPWNPGHGGRAYVPIPHDTFVFTILFVFQSAPCTSPKKELSKASQGLLGWIWRVSTWKRVQKRIEWEWSWWPQFQSEVKQFHPSFWLCVSRGVQLGPRANEISSHLRHWQPARPKRKTSVRIMRGMPCKCGCKNPRNIQPIQSYLLDKDSEMLESGVGCATIYGSSNTWTHVSEHVGFPHIFKVFNTCGVKGAKYCTKWAWLLWIVASKFIDPNWCDPITHSYSTPPPLLVPHIDPWPGDQGNKKLCCPPATRRPCSFLRRTQDLTVGRPASPLWLWEFFTMTGLWMAMDGYPWL